MKIFTIPLLVVLIGIHSVFTFAQQNDTLEMQRNKNGKIILARFQPSNARRFTDGSRFLRKILAAKGSHEFRLAMETTDELGFLHQRYNQFYMGIKVENAEYLMHGRNGMIETVNGEYPDIDTLSASPRINELAAFTKANDYVGAKKYKWQDAALEKLIKETKKDPEATYYPKGELVFAIGSLKRSSRYVLSWKFIISSLVPENEQIIYVNATNGEIIADVPLLCNINIACTAQTRYSGTQNITGDTFAGGNRLREIRNTTAGNTANIVTLNIQNGFIYANAVDFANNTTNFTNGNWPTFNQNQPALDVHWGIERVLDYWATVHQRNSINGLGLQATNYVHYNDPNSPAGWPNNAQWDGNGMAMRFGDGDGTTFNPLVSIDITSHELGHGINQFTANLTPGTTESGALNEGFSDMWGASVENWAAPNKQTWLIGEEIFATSTFNCIRNLQNPKSSTASEGKHPNTYHGQFWDNNGEPHNNSTVLSHWFYLVSQGGSGTNDNSNNYNVTAIGINNARRIAFRALSVYLGANSGYNDARTQTINAARDLFCDNSKEVAAVTNAWYAVGVGAAHAGTVPSIAGTEPVCTSQTFTVQNPIAGSTPTWSSANSNGLAINANSGNATRMNNFNGQVVITANIANNGCATFVSKSVRVGNYLPTGSSGYQSNCSGTTYNILNTSLSATCSANTQINFSDTVQLSV
ncbi:MAG: M4 family metallopeptidase [Bacteroidetes bacterium]|nr:M4 family metallopeptidase [Bacteroidota bacterium]